MGRTQFSDDNPKSNPWTEDRLGYAPFAKRLAASIIEIDAPNGYVIGLQGAWGSGKSTALNFVQAILKKYNDELDDDKKAIHVIDFRPWIVSGHQDLIESFFKIMTEKLADQKDAWAKRGKAGLRALRKNVDPLVDATAAIGSILAPGIGSLGGIGLKLASETAKKAGASKLDGWLAEPSLQSAYEKLRARIGDQNQKFLVIIDDIDRLNHDEIREIMQMVKTLGRLPNVVYLLAYDRNIVWPALDSNVSSVAGGPSFAEKIVQQEIELPRPGRDTLLEMLDGEIGFLTANTEQGERWVHIVVAGVRRWIQHPRDVARLANAVKFTWPAVEGEIDPQDLLAIEGIRLFDPAVFDWIRQHRDAVLGSSGWSMSSKKDKEALAYEFLLSIPKAEQSPVIRLLCTLLPRVSEIFDKDEVYRIGLEPHYKVVNRRGLGSAAGYDTYFSLHPSDAAVSKKTVDRALHANTDLAIQIDAIKQLLIESETKSISLIGEYFQDLRYRLLENSRSPPSLSLLQAIFECGKQIHSIDNGTGSFNISPGDNSSFLLREICKIHKGDALHALLQDLFSKKSSLSFCAEFWTWRAREAGLLSREGREEEPMISEGILLDLRDRLVGRIEHSIEDGSIHEEPRYFDIAAVWAHGGNEDRVKNWICEYSHADGKFLAKICKGILGYTVGSNPRKYAMYNRPRESFYDLPRLHGASLIHLDNTTLSDDERSRIRALHDGLAVILSSQSQVSEDLPSAATDSAGD